MRKLKLLLVVLAAFSLFAASCGADDVVDSATEAVTDAADNAVDAVDDAMSDDDDAMEDDAMEDDAMEDDAMEDDAMEDDAMEDDAMADDAMGDCGFDHPDEINVAYFEEWPTANQVAQANQTYDERLCTTVNWLPFPSGNEMSLAMESGDVDISYSQGLTPFANAVTSGADLEMVGVAVGYADADQCIVHPDYGITKDNAADFEGQAVYSPIGNVTHFQLLTQLDALGVDASAVNIIPSEGGAAAVAAFESGDVAMACAFGGSVLAMLELGGTPLSTVQEKLDMGIRVFDIISIPTSFGEQYPEALTEFLQVTEDANAAYAADRASTEATIAATAGMELDASNALLDQFVFYNAETQLSPAWMGGVAQDVMLEQMQFFQAQGEISDALGDYSSFVNTSFLAGVASYDAGAIAPAATTACPADAPSQINVAYFEEWPTANQVAQAEGTYDDVLCTEVNWLPFPSGNEMSLAMESGDVDISYSQGLTPFANAVTSGADLEMVGVAVGYADADQCIVHPDYGITKDNAADFEGQAVYSPIGNVTHFQLLTQLDALGVDASAVNIIPSEGGAAAVAAFESGDVAMACAFGGSVLAMLELGGTPLSTVQEKLDMGIRVFDIISIPTSFGEDHPETLVAFLQVTEDANAKYGVDRASTEATIAATAGMELDASNALLDQFVFYDKDAQLSSAWMGGVAQDVMLEQMQFFQAQGEIADALSDYSGFVNTSFLEQVN